MPTSAKPNLFIVGAQKSGTGALAGWLGQHPQVRMSFPKEPGYLAFKEKGYTYQDGYGQASPASQYVVTDEQAYLDLFVPTSDDQSVFGEASTWYFAIKGMAQKIKTFSPDANVIVILRNPVERAYSAWCHARGDRMEPCETFHAALDMESQRGEVEFLLRYRYMGLYSDALTEYQTMFPARLMVIFYEDLRANPENIWQQVSTFLNIDPSINPIFSHKYNLSGQPRNRLLHSLLRSHRFKNLIQKVLPHQVAIRIKQRADALNLVKFPPMDAKSKRELIEYFRKDIEQLSQLTERDLAAWLN